MMIGVLGLNGHDPQHAAGDARDAMMQVMCSKDPTVRCCGQCDHPTCITNANRQCIVSYSCPKCADALAQIEALKRYDFDAVYKVMVSGRGHGAKFFKVSDVLAVWETRLPDAAVVDPCSQHILENIALRESHQAALAQIEALKEKLTNTEQHLHVYSVRAHAERDKRIQLESELAAAKRDGERLDWLQAHPRLSEMHIEGKVVNCYAYAIAGHSKWTLRELIDAAIEQGGRGNG